jgi:tetratricopeptide (TPR) repeat protein
MRLAVATRSMNDFLYEASGALLGLGCPRHRLTGTDNFGYFRELLRLDADWVINLDEDAFVLSPDRLLGLVRVMEEGGYAACGMPDGGVVPIRRHNPAACNAFFNVFDLRRVRRDWRDWGRVEAATPRPEYEGRVAAFARRTPFAFDHFERYYGPFFALHDAGERILFLDAEEWPDGLSTLLKDAAGAPLLIHCWYARYWATSHNTRRRYQAVIDHARQVQGLNGSPVERRISPQSPPAEVRCGALTSAPPELLALIPQAARRILDIGACEDIESWAPETPCDCLVCQGELAGLRDPEGWLRRVRGWLTADGHLIAALPNGRHHAILGNLLQGRWASAPAGPARRPQVRFFTRREVEKLFYRAGFAIRRLEGVPGPGHQEWQARGRPREVRVAGLHLGGLAPEEAEEFYVAHYLVDAAPAPPPDHGLTSIIIVTHNQLGFTRLCLDSIRQLTDEPYELILVDNGSDDGTADYTLFNLAMTCTDAGRYEDGLRYARRCLAHSADGASHLRKAYAYVVSCHERLGQAEAAWQACQEGLRRFPLDDELRFRRGVLLHGRGRLEEAARAYLDLLGAREEPHFSSVVTGLAGHLARHNLALVYRDLGDLGREEEQWRRVVEERPGYRPGWRGLGDVLVRRGKAAEARAVAERLLGDGRLRGEGRVLLGALAATRGDYEAARGELERGAAECPEDPAPLEALCQLLFEHGAPADAEGALRELVRRVPGHASALHNLGTVCLRLRRPQAAVEAYRQSLQHRPDAVETHLHLGHALRDVGRLEDAVAAWEAALRLEPVHHGAREALRQAGRPVP